MLLTGHIEFGKNTFTYNLDHTRKGFLVFNKMHLILLSYLILQEVEVWLSIFSEPIMRPWNEPLRCLPLGHIGVATSGSYSHQWGILGTSG